MQINETINSPNQSSRYGYIPQLIVCHIADGTYNGTKTWFLNSASQVSSHFVVSQAGKICQCVGLDKMAWCNGTSTTAGANNYYGYSTVPLIQQLGGNANWYSISIEFEGYYSKTKGALTDAQIKSAVWLINHIREQVKDTYNHYIPITRDYIVGHYQINPKTRASCPGESFPWAQLMANLETTPEPDTDIIKGSIVQFTGGSVYASSTTSTPSGTRQSSKCEVTATANAIHPYHLISIDDGTVYGWVNAADVERSDTRNIAVGDVVKITGTRYSTGQTIPAWVKASTHKVSQINNDRALLGANGGISSWVNLSDLTIA